MIYNLGEMIYNLGEYRYKAGKIYRKTFLCFYKCIDRGPYGFMEGIRRVNRLCGVEE